MMFQLIDGFGDHVVAVRGVGRVTADDYRAVLNPALERASADGDKLRLYLELGEGFEGYAASAMLTDAQLGMDHVRSFDRIAVVTDAEWVRSAVHLFGPIIPGDVRAFRLADTTSAREWIREGS